MSVISVNIATMTQKYRKNKKILSLRAFSDFLPEFIVKSLIFFSVLSGNVIGKNIQNKGHYK